MRCQTEAGTFSSVEHNETRKDEVLMAKQDKPTSEGKQQGRGMLWRGLIIRARLLSIPWGGFLPSFCFSSSPPFPLPLQGSLPPARPRARLEAVGPIALLRG